MKTTSRPMKAAMVVAAVALITSACGSSRSSSQQPTGKPKTGSSQVPATGSSQLLSKAKAEIARYTAIPTFTPTGPPVDAAKLKGKTILIVMHDTVADALVGIQHGIQQAGAAVGLHVESDNGQGTVSTIVQDVQQGITQHVAAIILEGVDPALIPTSVSAAIAAKIPVITATDGLRTGSSADKGIFSMVSGDYTELGRVDADTALVDSAGKPIYAVVENFDNPVSRAAIVGINEVFSTCSYCHIVATQTIEPTSWPTKIPGTTASLIQAHPNVNVVFPVVDTMALFATAGVNQAGASGRVKIISQDGSSEGTLGLVQKGTAFVADPGVSEAWEGWQVVDEVLRALSGMSPGNPVVPFRYLDNQNLAGMNLKNLGSVYGTSYVAGFKRLWGVG